VKLHQRLEYARLAEVLAERAMCEPQALREALQISGRGSPAFAEAVVGANLVGDWELGKVVAEVYNLAFLPVELCEPDEKALDGLDLAYLAQHGLVPLARFGQVLTVAMPGMVASEVLAGIRATDADLTIVPVVGSVAGNRRWIEQRLQPKLHAALPTLQVQAQGEPGEWGNLFDTADQAVLFELQGGQPDTGAP
jgi:hypothetical protein